MSDDTPRGDAVERLRARARARAERQEAAAGAAVTGAPDAPPGTPTDPLLPTPEAAPPDPSPAAPEDVAEVPVDAARAESSAAPAVARPAAAAPPAGTPADVVPPAAAAPAVAPPAAVPAVAAEPAPAPVPADVPAQPAGVPVGSGDERRRSAGPLLAAVSMLVVIVVLASGLLVVAVHRLSERHSGSAGPLATNGDDAPVVAAAVQGLQATLSYDYRHLPQDFAAAEKTQTPSFRATYSKTTTRDLTVPATKYHAVTTAKVVAAGVVSSTSSTATVLAFLDNTSSNSQLTADRLDRSRVKVGLRRIDGRWLLDSISSL